jgi:hypothetical protein
MGGPLAEQHCWSQPWTGFSVPTGPPRSPRPPDQPGHSHGPELAAALNTNPTAWVNAALRLKAERDRRLQALDEFLGADEAEHGEITDEEMREAARRARPGGRGAGQARGASRGHGAPGPGCRLMLVLDAPLPTVGIGSFGAREWRRASGGRKLPQQARTVAYASDGAVRKFRNRCRPDWTRAHPPGR